MSLSGKKLAFVFPGQGSQFVGMASDYAKHELLFFLVKVLNSLVWRLICKTSL